MTAQRINADANSGLTFRVTDRDGRPVQLRIVGPENSVKPPNFLGGFLQLNRVGGDHIFLTQQNVQDLLPMLTQYAVSGVIS